MANEILGVRARLAKLEIADYDPSQAKVGAVVTDVAGMVESVKLNLDEAASKLNHLLDKVLLPTDPKSADAQAVREMLAAIS